MRAAASLERSFLGAITIWLLINYGAAWPICILNFFLLNVMDKTIISKVAMIYARLWKNITKCHGIIGLIF